MATQMPPVAQFKLPTQSQQQVTQPASQNNGMPPVAQFKLPNQTQNFSTQNLGLGQGGELLKEVGNFLFPAVGDAYHDIKGDSTKTPLQQAGDVGLSALTLVPGLGEVGKAAEGASLAAKTLSGAAKIGALGYGADVSSNLAQGKTSTSDVLTPGLGTLAGGLLGGSAPAAADLLDKIPASLAKSVFKGAPDKSINYALENKPVGTVSSMFKDSTNSINEAGKAVKTILSSEKYAKELGNGSQSFIDALSKFSNSDMKTVEDVAAEVKSVAPLFSRLADKVANGEATLEEKNVLRSAIDKNTYRGSADLPRLTASKQIANEVANSLRGEVQTIAPETAEHFKTMTSEFPLQKALAKMDKNSAAHLGLYDILSAIGGGAAGLPGAGGAVLAERTARSPLVKFGAAKALKGAIPFVKKVSPLLRSGLLRSVTPGSQPQQ